MAFPWVPTQYGPQGRQLAWLNTVFTSHGIFCGCDSAYTHFITACNNNNYIQLTKKEIEQASTCHTSNAIGFEENQGQTTTPGDIITEEDFLGEGDLQKLFEEPFEEEQTTTG